MSSIILAILILAGLGLLAGLVLAVASVVMAVPRDEKAEALRDLLMRLSTALVVEQISDAAAIFSASSI